VRSEAILSIPQLRSRFAGRGIGPEDPEYDAARTVFPGGFDKRPAMIIRPADAEEVSGVVHLRDGWDRGRTRAGPFRRRRQGRRHLGRSKHHQAVLRAGLLDEMHIHLIPILLGGGVRLFEDLDPEGIELRRTSSIETPSATHFRFEVVK